MFILKDKTQLERAIAKALKIRPRVKYDHFGRYRVSGSKGGFYTVICKKSDNGYKTVACTCKGAELGLVCYPPFQHLVCTSDLHGNNKRQPFNVKGLGKLYQNFPKPLNIRKELSTKPTDTLILTKSVSLSKK